MWLRSLLFSVILWFSPMAAIAHAFTEQNTAQTTTSASYVDIPGASIASGNFTAGKKYLIVATAQQSINSAEFSDIQILHGTTVFPANDSAHSVRPGAANEYSIFSFMTVWTAVSGEGIKLQFRTNATLDTVTADAISLLAINLSDDVTENTDWFFAEDAVDISLSTTFQDGASITFTPSTTGHDWLIIVNTYMWHNGSTTTSPITRINRSGEAASSLPETRLEGPASLVYLTSLSRVFNLGNASNTFKEQSAVSAGTVPRRLNSTIFALNLNKFRNHANAYTEADVSLSATDFATQLQTISITPGVISDTWIGGYWGFDKNSNAREGEFRVQNDQADQPTGQTADLRQFDMGNDATDEQPLILSTMVTNLSAAAHTIDLDASADSTVGTPAGQHRTLWAMTMELAVPPVVLPPTNVIVLDAVHRAFFW